MKIKKTDFALNRIYGAITVIGGGNLHTYPEKVYELEPEYVDWLEDADGAPQAEYDKYFKGTKIFNGEPYILKTLAADLNAFNLSMREHNSLANAMTLPLKNGNSAKLYFHNFNIEYNLLTTKQETVSSEEHWWDLHSVVRTIYRQSVNFAFTGDVFYVLNGKTHKLSFKANIDENGKQILQNIKLHAMFFQREDNKIYTRPAIASNYADDFVVQTGFSVYFKDYTNLKFGYYFENALWDLCENGALNTDFKVDFSWLFNQWMMNHDGKSGTTYQTFNADWSTIHDKDFYKPDTRENWFINAEQQSKRYQKEIEIDNKKRYFIDATENKGLIKVDNANFLTSTLTEKLETTVLRDLVGHNEDRLVLLMPKMFGDAFKILRDALYEQVAYIRELRDKCNLDLESIAIFSEKVDGSWKIRIGGWSFRYISYTPATWENVYLKYLDFDAYEGYKLALKEYTKEYARLSYKSGVNKVLPYTDCTVSLNVDFTLDVNVSGVENEELRQKLAEGVNKVSKNYIREIAAPIELSVSDRDNDSEGDSGKENNVNVETFENSVNVKKVNIKTIKNVETKSIKNNNLEKKRQKTLEFVAPLVAPQNNSVKNRQASIVLSPPTFERNFSCSNLTNVPNKLNLLQFTRLSTKNYENVRLREIWRAFNTPKNNILRKDLISERNLNEIFRPPISDKLKIGAKTETILRPPTDLYSENILRPPTFDESLNLQQILHLHSPPQSSIFTRRNNNFSFRHKFTHIKNVAKLNSIFITPISYFSSA